VTDVAHARVLLVGIGGLGCPAAIVLVRAGVAVLAIADDDEVDLSNLHRQILFSDGDVGRPKVPAAVRALGELGGRTKIEALGTRLLPPNAVELVSAYDLVVEGSDNFATKFLAADACALARRPIVHGAAVRWHGTALAVAGSGRPCYRCLFEDVPRENENPPNCAEAGVIGPMVGVVAAAQADLALSMLSPGSGSGSGSPARADVAGELFRYDGRTGEVRRRKVAPRPGCPLCGGGIDRIDPRRYTEGLSN
jgi:molybdopterin/thiamine biosynthesis adenylyltransferase